MAERLAPTTWLLPTALATLAAMLGVAAGADPRLAIAGAFGFALVLLTLGSLFAGLVVFVALSFMELVPEIAGPGLSFVKVAGALLFTSWLAVVASGQNTRLFPSAHPGLTAVLFIFLGWNLFSVAWAAEPTRVYASAISFALSAALFPIVYSAARNTESVRWLILAYVAGATFAGLYAIIAQPNAAALASSPSAASGLDRLQGTIGDPNELAALLAAGVALSTAIIFNRAVAPPLRLATVGCAAIMLLGVFLTLSRGGLVALAALIVAGMFFAGRYRLMAIGAGLAMLLVAGAFFFGVASDQARDRITSTDGGSGRTDIWQVGWRMVEAEPALGVGSGNFQNSAINYLIGPGTIRNDEFLVDTPSVAHNAYLQVLAETGVPGLTMFMLAIVICMGLAVSAQRRFRRDGNHEGELLCTAVLLAISALLAAYFFLSEEHSKHLWLLLSLGPALYGVSRRSSPNAA